MHQNALGFGASSRTQPILWITVPTGPVNVIVPTPSASAPDALVVKPTM